MLSSLLRATPLALGLAAACGGSVTAPPTSSSSSSSSSGGGAPVASSLSTTTSTAASSTSGAGGACDDTMLPVLLDHANGYVDRVHVPVTFEGEARAMLFDTGSNLTFLDEPIGSPDPVLDAGSVTIGCATETLIGRPVVPEDPFMGLVNVGSIGVDFTLAGPTKLDFDASRFVRHSAGAPFDDASAWPAADLEISHGVLIAHVVLDGSPVRLIVDTGSPDILWVGQLPQPGDVEVDTEDAQGNLLKLYQGTVDAGLGGSTRNVPVLRAPSFPYFEMTVKALGGNIAGLLGLSALGDHAIVFDADAKKLRLAL